MKTSTTNRHSATSHLAASRTVRGLAIACALFGAVVVAQNAAAVGCPVGYIFQPGSGCVPAPTRPPPPERAKSVQRYEAKSLDNSSVSYGQADKPHSPIPIYKAREQGFQGPVGPGTRHTSDQTAGGTHGIIFVGGHSVPTRDKAALNPQPIPPTDQSPGAPDSRLPNDLPPCVPGMLGQNCDLGGGTADVHRCTPHTLQVLALQVDSWRDAPSSDFQQPIAPNSAS